MTQPLIPVAEVRESDFWAALKPLLDLLGTTPMHMYAEPPVAITLARDPDTLAMHVRFQHAVEDVNAESPWPKVATSDDDFGEWAYDVDVRVRPTRHNVVDVLWPGERPKAVPTSNGMEQSVRELTDYGPEGCL